MSVSSIIASQTASSNSAGASNKLAEDLDSFLLILTTQLQNQDPLSPMDSTEFTNQLVEFANVEQAINQTQRLEDLIGLQKATELNNAVSYMGKSVKVDHNEFTHKAGTTEEFEYTLPETAKNAALFVFNKAGNLVYSAPVETAQGTHSVTWDAKDGSGNPMPAGDYHFEVSATNAEAKTIENIKYAYSAVVDSVEFGETNTTLKMGNVSVDLGKVIEVKEPPAS
ncbi:flagellar hook assembly protein FlgD [Curvivirga aplysinae]|uniref:flagellar hook assembly protein FlgD n=1 Tax=Curvivirga aplysinae TaxID=2529852 RepID=UPI0012BCB5AA|nr:flagellar hook assembly protein FlgD [Curvivirga aplysinae]MTI10562.1 flagellar hook assembly protein FlgD [Curvivirga aplysinae]